MQKNELYLKNGSVLRVLEERGSKVLVIDCVRRTMPQWKVTACLNGWEQCSQETLYAVTNVEVPEIDSLCPESRKKAYERYTMIAPILRLLPDEQKKCEMISTIATSEKISKQTVRKYLCLYLVFQDIVAMLTQLINSSGISIGMVGTPDTLSLLETAFQLARRSLGLQYNTLNNDEYFMGFCKLLFQYQYVKTHTNITPQIIDWLYDHSGGVASVVVSLIHDAQELAILEGHEIFDISTLNQAYEKRMQLLHDYIRPATIVTNTAVKVYSTRGFEKGIENYNYFAIFACMCSDISGNLW